MDITRVLSIIVLSLIAILIVPLAARGQDTVEIHYGNWDNSPIWGVPGLPTRVDVWIRTTANTYMANMRLCLGARDMYIDSLFGLQAIRPGWEIPACSSCVYHSPPNPVGWSSRSASIELSPPANTSIYPRPVLSFFVRTINDTSLVGDTIVCLGPGVTSTLGGSSVGDTLGGPGYPVVEYFSPLMIAHDLPPLNEYSPGDINGDGQVTAGDVTFGINYYTGAGSQPPDSSWHIDLPLAHWIYMAADANGDCRNSGADVTYVVGWFKWHVRAIRFCPLTPPASYYWPRKKISWLS